MSATPAFASSPSSKVSLDLGLLGEHLCAVLGSCGEHEYEAETVSASLVMLAGELHSSCHHGLEKELLAPQFGELLCGVVHLATLCGVDVVGATTEHLRVEEGRRHAARPDLRPVQ